LWVGRTASTVFGLALILALIFGVATMALGATGGTFVLGKGNSAGATTKLTLAVAGPVLQLVNNGTSTAAAALNLSVPSGRAPLTVNASAGKATNLNADRLDGLDSTDIGRQRWAVINADGTMARSNGGKGALTARLGTGHYRVVFDTSVANCAYVASTTGGFAGQTGVLRTATDFSNWVQVFTTDSAGEPANLPFHVIVTC
jgi:ABC-type antimicrobial peptide transport system permease subunit